jgi:hypothetical protein
MRLEDVDVAMRKELFQVFVEVAVVVVAEVGVAEF